LNGKNKAILGLASFAAFTAGLLLPSLALVLGGVTRTFNPSSDESIKEVMSKLFLNILLVAFVVWFLGYLQYALF
jgi:hypothetical protein